MNGEPKPMKMPSYLKKRLKDGMIKEFKSVSLKSENMFFYTTLVSDSLQENSSQNGKDPMLSRRSIDLEPSKKNNAEGTNPKVVNGQRIKHYISGTPINVESNIIQTLTPETHKRVLPEHSGIMKIRRYMIR